ncbi:bacteriohemerythrin [Aestuariirhabdus sp. LZHN29]|uniref:bacteriohemerythrin n=1 Tax=Aestuariirhabdus sp. LZHN29 TaxID=3417462 RepID=UPI003CE724FC
MDSRHSQVESSLLWSKRLELGVKVLDKEHRDLLAGFAGLGLMVGRQCSAASLQKRFQHCFELLLVHLRHEEELMIRYHYPLYNEHLMSNSRLVKSIFGLGAQLASRNPPDDLDGQVYALVHDILPHHIDRVDRPLAEYLRMRGVR